MSSGPGYRQRGLAVKPQNRKGIRKLANQVRRLLDLDEDRIDMCQLLEHKLHECGIAFLVDDPSSPELAPDEHACAYPEAGIIVLSSETYDGLCNDNHRARFTVAHEFGHMLLHGSTIQGLSRGLDPNRPHKPYCDLEWQADTFAAELLMPAERARGLSEQDIMDRFGVSWKAAEIRRSVLENEQATHRAG